MSLLLGLQFSDLRTSRGDELLVRVGVPGKSPPAVGRLGEEDPRAVGERRVPRRVRHESREPADHGQLLVTIECTGVREDLDANIGAVSVDVRQPRRRKLVHERGRVLAEHRDVGHLLDRHQFGRQVLANAWVSPNVPAAA